MAARQTMRNIIHAKAMLDTHIKTAMVLLVYIKQKTIYVQNTRHVIFYGIAGIIDNIHAGIHQTKDDTCTLLVYITQKTIHVQINNTRHYCKHPLHTKVALCLKTASAINLHDL